MERVLPDRMKPHMSPTRTDSGYALVLVIWIFGIIGILVSTAAWNARLKAQAARNIVESIKAEALADGIVSLAKLAVISSLGDKQEGRWTALAEIVRTGFVICQAPGGTAAISLENEAEKVDLNAASAETLASLLRRVGVGDVEAGRISLAIKKYSQLPYSTEQAERGDVSERDGDSTPPKQAPFETIFELDQVEGMKRDLFETLLPYVTVYSGRSDIDLSVAPPRLKAASFATSLRERNPFEAATRQRFSPIEKMDLRVASGEKFLVHTEALTVGGGIFAREETIRIASETDPLHAMEWRRGRMRHHDVMKTIPAGRLPLPECDEGWR